MMNESLLFQTTTTDYPKDNSEQLNYVACLLAYNPLTEGQLISILRVGFLYGRFVTLCTASLTCDNSTFCPHSCIFLFCVDLRTNSDYFPIQH